MARKAHRRERGRAGSNSRCHSLASDMQAFTTNVPYAFTNKTSLKSFTDSVILFVHGRYVQGDLISFKTSERKRRIITDLEIAAQCTPPNKLPLGMTSRAALQAAVTESTSEISVLK
jgi:hypothetical protein